MKKPPAISGRRLGRDETCAGSAIRCVAGSVVVGMLECYTSILRLPLGYLIYLLCEAPALGYSPVQRSHICRLWSSSSAMPGGSRSRSRSPGASCFTTICILPSGMLPGPSRM